jgi:hypothetical protein
MRVEADDVKSRTPFLHAADELREVQAMSGAQVRGVCQGPDDALRSLLGREHPVHPHSSMAERGGDEISAGDFSLPRGLGDPVEIPPVE